MKRFEIGLRVRVTNHETMPELNGKTGTVVRVCTDPDRAWVNMDGDIPDALRSLYRDECEPVAR